MDSFSEFAISGFAMAFAWAAVTSIPLLNRIRNRYWSWIFVVVAAIVWHRLFLLDWGHSVFLAFATTFWGFLLIAGHDWLTTPQPVALPRGRR